MDTKEILEIIKLILSAAKECAVFLFNPPIGYVTIPLIVAALLPTFIYYSKDIIKAIFGISKK